MKRMVGFGLLISGVALIGYAAFQIHWHHASAEKALAIAEEMITTQKESDQAESESVGELYKTGALRYQVDDVIGILSIPALEETYPIIEGTDEEMLMKGVGHYATTALPGGNEQILLSGHKGTVFRINYAVRFFCRIEREKTKPMAFSVANMQNMGLLIPISMCGHKQDSVFFIRRHDKETYGYSIF